MATHSQLAAELAAALAAEGVQFVDGYSLASRWVAGRASLRPEQRVCVHLSCFLLVAEGGILKDSVLMLLHSSSYH